MSIKGQGLLVIERVLVSQTVPSHPLTRVKLSTSLSAVHKVLINSGAYANFTDQQLAEEISLDFVQLDKPLKATSLDGGHLWCVKYRTTPVKVTFSDGYFELLSFLICSAKTQPLWSLLTCQDLLL